MDHVIDVITQESRPKCREVGVKRLTLLLDALLDAHEMRGGVWQMYTIRRLNVTKILSNQIRKLLPIGPEGLSRLSNSFLA